MERILHLSRCYRFVAQPISLPNLSGSQKVYRADHLERGFLGHWIHALAAAAESTLFDHRGGKGSGEPEMAGLALPACGWRACLSLTFGSERP